MVTGVKSRTKAGPGGQTMGALAILDTLPKESRKTFKCDIRRIRPDPKQPRSSLRPVDGQIDEETQKYLVELAENIKQIGLQEPIKLREDPEFGPGYWMLVYGECRWRAHLILSDEGNTGFDFIDAYEQRDVDDMKRRLIQIAENIQRRNLSDIETGTAMKDMLAEFPELEHKDLAEIWNKERSYVTRMMSMVDPQYAELISSGAITHATVLEQYRALTAKSQRALLAQSQNSGNAITMTDVRNARSAEKTERPAQKPQTSPQQGRGRSGSSAAAAVSAPAYQEFRLRIGQMAKLLGFIEDDAGASITMQMSVEKLRETIERMGGQPAKNDLQLVQQLIDLMESKKSRR